MEKKTVNYVHLGELIKITFNYRIEIILSSNLKISELQDTFPALKFQEWVSMIKCHKYYSYCNVAHIIFITI